MTPETQETASGTGFCDWKSYYVGGPIIATAQTQNETYRVYVDGTPVLFRSHRVHQRKGAINVPIADHQIYVHGIVEKESPRGLGIKYNVKPISNDSELARKVTDHARRLFPYFSGELYFHK